MIPLTPRLESQTNRPVLSVERENSLDVRLKTSLDTGRLIGAYGWGKLYPTRIVEASDSTGAVAASTATLQAVAIGTAFGAPVGLFCYYMSLNHTDCAAMWLEKAIGQRDTRTPWIVPHLLGSLFTSSPKWQELAKRMNLT